MNENEMVFCTTDIIFMALDTLLQFGMKITENEEMSTGLQILP